MPATESCLQSKARPALSRPRHQLLLLLTKVPAAQSQGEEVVLLELVEDLLSYLRRELVETLVGALDLLHVDLLPRQGAARGRRPLSLRHLPFLRDASTEKPALAISVDQSRVCSSSRVLDLPPRPSRRSPGARRCLQGTALSERAVAIASKLASVIKNRSA